jgi:O-antigen/teichoic acid export membrane protein
VLRGGLFLAVRQAIGFVLGVASTILVTRTIGPAAYGLFAAAYGIFCFLSQLSQWGITVYLIRTEEEVVEDLFHQAFSLLLALGIGMASLALLAIPLIERVVKLQGFAAVAFVFFLGLPFYLLTQVPLARLERNMDYQRLALIELAGQVVFFVVAVFLAFKGFGVWAPVTGFWASQLVAGILLYRISGYIPKLIWNRQVVREMIAYGLGFSSSIWIWQLRTLVNPVLVSRCLGAEAVGYVAVAITLVNKMCFVKNATWRLSIAALSRVQGNRSRLAQAVQEGMQLQVMALGPILVAFLCVAPWLLPIIYGDRWLPVLVILPYVALGSLTNALFNLHSSVLYVLRRNWEVTQFHLLHVALFAGSAAVLVPRFGLLGYGLAEIAALPSYGLINKYLTKEVGGIRYAKAATWFLPFAAALYVHQIGWWAALLLVVPLLWRDNWADIVKTLRAVRN